MGTEEFKIITSEEGSYAVVRVDPDQPRFLEVIATFYDVDRARDYARFENNRSYQPREAEPKPEPEEKEPATQGEVPAGLSERQQALLTALHAKKDKNNLVEARTRELAQATDIPLGSIHGVLGSLEKKNLIQTKRPGSVQSAAIYELLETPSKGDLSINDDQDNGTSEE